jgi:hypothetical protein
MKTVVLIAFICALILSGCASEDKFMLDRWADFADIFKADVGVGIGAGAQLRATELLSLGAGGGVMWKTGFKGRYSGSWKDIEIGWPVANIAFLAGLCNEMEKAAETPENIRQNESAYEPDADIAEHEYRSGNTGGKHYSGGGNCSGSNVDLSKVKLPGGKGDKDCGDVCGALITAYFCIPMDFSFVGMLPGEIAKEKFVPGGYSSFSIFGANIHPLAPDFLGFSRYAPGGFEYFDLEAGVFLGFTSLHAGVSPGQLWDFAAGWFGLDPASDDAGGK